MNRPLLKFDDLGAIPAELDASAREAFEADFGDGLAVYAGCVVSSWRGDFTHTGGCWDLVAGKWTGPAPSRAVPSNLRIDGATVDESGAHPVTAISAGEFIAACELQEAGALVSPTVRFKLWNATTGALVETIDVTGSGTFVAPFEAVVDGSYQLAAHIPSPRRAPITRAFYLSITGVAVSAIYEYSENDTTYFWDYTRNLGRLPSDTTHDSYEQRATYVDSGTTLDRPEWADYITAGASIDNPDEGEWSMLRLLVGAGAWSAGTDILPNPGAALLKKNGASWDGVAFDTTARGIGASLQVRYGNAHENSDKNTTAGDWIIAGTMATRTGPVAAFWRVRDNAGTPEYSLMAWNIDPSDGLCQCAKRNHGINGIVEKQDGALYFLSECSLMTFDPSGENLSLRLVGFPYAAEGHPGGYSIENINEVLSFFTENFSASPEGEVNFYNRLQEFTSGRRNTGPGTAWHGRDCSAALWGFLWGFSQDAAWSSEDAAQALSYLSQGRWNRESYRSSTSASQRWKSLAAVAGKLLCAGIAVPTGKETSAQEVVLREGENLDPLWQADDGREMKEYFAPYFPLYMTTCRDAAGEECVMAVARKVVIAEGETEYSLTAEEHVIRIYPEAVEICALWDDAESRFTWSNAVIEAAGGVLSQWPLYLWWMQDLSVAPGGYWLPHAVAPEDATIYLMVDFDENETSYVLTTGAMPYDTAIWDEICLTVHENGGIGAGGIPPQSSCAHAGCMFDKMPAGTATIIITPQLGGVEWQAIQVGDVNALDEDARRPLESASMQYPVLWARMNSDADEDDLTSYTHRLSFNRFESLPETARENLAVCVLVPPSVVAPLSPSVDRRG